MKEMIDHSLLAAFCISGLERWGGGCLSVLNGRILQRKFTNKREAQTYSQERIYENILNKRKPFF